MEKVCNERHKAIDQKITEHEKRLDEQEKELGGVLTASATNTADIKHLTKSLDALTKALWGFITTIALTAVGFLIWYVQSLPR